MVRRSVLRSAHSPFTFDGAHAFASAFLEGRVRRAARRAEVARYAAYAAAFALCVVVAFVMSRRRTRDDAATTTAATAAAAAVDSHIDPRSHDRPSGEAMASTNSAPPTLPTSPTKDIHVDTTPPTPPSPSAPSAPTLPTMAMRRRARTAAAALIVTVVAALIATCPAPSCQAIFDALPAHAWLARYRIHLRCSEWPPLLTVIDGQGALAAVGLPLRGGTLFF